MRVISNTLSNNCISQSILERLNDVIPDNKPFILVDECQWGLEELEKRKVIPFPERNGYYWGTPLNDEAAIAEVERQHERGIATLVFGQPAFWWLDYYKGLQQYLYTTFHCIHENDSFAVFDLKNKKAVSKFERCISDPLYKFNLVLFDDFLPNLKGSWRAAEMTYYLRNMDDVQLVCMENFYGTDAYGILDENNTFELNKIELTTQYGIENIARNIVSVTNWNSINVNTSLVYCIFLNNLKEIFEPVLEKYQLPFVFTLYPGGGLKINDPGCDAFLKKINASPLFKGVITTQQCIYDYILHRKLIDEDKIKMLYGAPFELKKYTLQGEKRYYKQNKDTLDICFVSAKYTTNGIDKGFDVFSQVAHKLSLSHPFTRFHVVGSFTEDDLLYDIPAEQITFYGYRAPVWFSEFYLDIDMIVSPVKPHVLTWGAVDGFPTAAVAEAGLYGAVMITSDPMGDNIAVKYKDGVEMVITESNEYAIAQAITVFIDQPELLPKIGSAGKLRMNEVLATDIQLGERLKYLKEKLEENVVDTSSSDK